MKETDFLNLVKVVVFLLTTYSMLSSAFYENLLTVHYLI